MDGTPIHLFYTAELFYPDLPGGLMRFFRYGPGLLARGIIPHMVTLRNDQKLEYEEYVNEILIHRLDPPSGVTEKSLRPWLLKNALEKAIKIRKVGGRAVLQPNILSHHMCYTMLRAYFYNIGIVYNIGIAPEPHPRSRIKEIMYQQFLKYCVNPFISKTVFLSHQLDRQYQSVLSLGALQKEVIPNGVDIDRFKPSENLDERLELRSSLGIGEKQKVVLFVGGIMPRKGVDILLRAWNQVQAEHVDAVLLLLGSNTLRPSHNCTGLRAELIEYLAFIDSLRSTLNCPQSVRLLGEIKDPAPYYRVADVFAFPSRLEGLPNVVLEGMASELPSLVARFDGFPRDGQELGYAGKHYIELGHEPDEWALELKKILRSENTFFRQDMGKCARSFIESYHRLPNILDRWQNVYQEAAFGNIARK